MCAKNHVELLQQSGLVETKQRIVPFDGKVMQTVSVSIPWKKLASEHQVAWTSAPIRSMLGYQVRIKAMVYDPVDPLKIRMALLWELKQNQQPPLLSRATGSLAFDTGLRFDFSSELRGAEPVSIWKNHSFNSVRSKQKFDSTSHDATLSLEYQIVDILP
jgi:hypothetical protein